MAIAAGCVLTRYTNAVLGAGPVDRVPVGFHFQRPIQNSANAPGGLLRLLLRVQAGWLVERGGFPERTIVEDMDYTWTQQIGGIERSTSASGGVRADPDRCLSSESR